MNRDASLLDSLTLAFLSGATPRRVSGWRDAALTPADIVASRGNGIWTPAQIRAAKESAHREQEASVRAGVAIIPLDDPRYPDLLARIPDPPFVLWARGPLQLTAPVAVVGARRADTYGRHAAELFGRGLAAAGCTVVSGLAWGVDAAAHHAAAPERGGTTAVFGTGVDVVYPREHASLANNILAHGGSLISELPLGTGPQRGHFPSRNRIVAGLTLGAIIVQAGEKSGALITAGLSLDYNRLVWAVPDRIGEPLAVGSLSLLRAGASVARSVDDVLEDIRPLLPAPASPLVVAPHRRATPTDPLLASLESRGATIDELVIATGREREELLGKLLRLELAGRVAAEPGGIYRLTG